MKSKNRSNLMTYLRLNKKSPTIQSGPEENTIRRTDNPLKMLSIEKSALLGRSY